MTYKFKSLIYFCFFLIASTIYYGVEQYDKFQEHLRTKELVENTFEDHLEQEESQDEVLTDQQ